jgi:TolB-like protein/tetratricopeptide (TPR) repeat protein/tRNA A-37 threonylcarbamoyl transferase component Bud32
MSEFPPSLLTALEGRYTIERLVGQGGMAAVYLATDLRHERRVAVKVLDPELARAVGTERFLREIRFSARLNHPNILPLHDSGEADGFLYYIMPYVEGDSLRERLARERHLSLEETVGIVRQVAAALDHAHAQGVVHRDIKPENILLTGGQAVVADFGIARAVGAAGSQRLTETGLAIGTPAYMSPEQANADGTVDGRADVYSLGCVAYEMLGGEPPFTGASPLAVMARHAVDPVPSLRTLRSTTPPGVERAIRRALEKVPADRFATAGAFAEELARASSPGAIAQEARRGASRRRPRVLAAAALTVLAAVAGWWGIHARDHGIRRFAVLPLEGVSSDSSQLYLVDGIHEELIADLARDGLGVIARTSVMQYRDTDKPVRQIARELGVDAVVEASLTRTSDSVSIEAGLVDGRTQQYLWTRSYTAAVRKLPALTHDVARAIARAVQPGRTVAPARPTIARAVDPQVYDAYLQGRFHLHRPGREELETARRYFELALSKDSTYAPAWAGISGVWGVGRQRGYFTPQEATPRADAAARKALALDSMLAWPHYALAVGRLYGHLDWQGAEREFQRAIALSPDDAEVRALYAHLLCILHRPREAVRQMDRARQLDPLDPALEWLDGAVLTVVRRYDDAIALYRQVLEKSPDNPNALWLLWVTLHNEGRRAEALAMARRWAHAVGDPAIGQALERGDSIGGYTGAMREVARYEVARYQAAPAQARHVSAWDVAIWFAAAGDNDHAIDWLDKAFQNHNPVMPYLAVHPSFDALHGDPRFQDLVRRMKLPA